MEREARQETEELRRIDQLNEKQLVLDKVGLHNTTKNTSFSISRGKILSHRLT